jgi:hypothetical protein
LNIYSRGESPGDPLREISIDKVLSRAYIRLQTQPKSVRETDAGDPGLWGVFLDKDRALSGPSPSANLAGFWKDVIVWIMATGVA